MPLSKLWADWTWQDFAATDMAAVTAVLPVAAVEQHGPHLPVGTDCSIMDGYLQAVLADVPPGLTVLILPTQTIGKSNEHVAFPGTLTLSAETVIRAWTEIGESVYRTGVRKLVLLNSHGGNVTSLDIVARDLRVRLEMLVVSASWHRFGYPDGLFTAEERAHGIHAGDVETSLMLHVRPDLVQWEKAADFVPASVAVEQDFRWLRVTQPIGFGWAAEDNSMSGAMGNAAAATEPKGASAADYGARSFIELLHDVQRFDLARLGRGPLA